MIRSTHRAAIRAGCALLVAFGPLVTCSARAGAQALRAPALVEPVTPEYPAGETAAALVELELTVDDSGVVIESRVITSGGAAFDAAALAAAPRLRFTPASRDGMAIPAVIPFAFEFAPPPAPAAPPHPPAAPIPTGQPGPGPPQPSAAEADVIGSVDLEVRGAPPLREATRHSLDVTEVRTIPGTGGDVLRSVETMPGVARPAYGQGLLVLRGSAPGDSQVFLDGTQIPYAYHVGDASIVPGDMLERLDFYPGNFGPEFGRGMGGVIDVGLRSPRRDRFGGLVQIDVIDGRFMLETPLGPDTGLMLGVRRSWVDAWIGGVLDSLDTSMRTAPVYYDAQLVLEHDVTPANQLRLSVFGADDRLRILIKSPGAQDPGFAGEFGGYTRFVRTQLRLDSELAPNTRWVNTLAWGVTDLDQAFGQNGFARTAHELTLRSDLRAELTPAITLNGGFDGIARIEEVRAQFRPYPATNAVEGPSFARPSRRVETDATLVRPAVYAGLEIRPVPSLKLLPSVRADYAADTEKVTFDPRLGARWDVTQSPRTTLKGGVGLYHQPPNLEESHDVVGTDGIGSNRALHTSLGIERELVEGLELSVEGFYKDLDELIVARADESRILGARFVNAGSGRIYGAEFLLRYKPIDGPLFGWVAYTLSRSERRDRDSDPYTLFEHDQTHILSAVANLSLGAGWTLGARFRWVTGRPYTPYFGGIVDLDAGAYSPLESGGLYSARLGSFHQLDLRVEKTWDFEAWKLAVYLELRNAYNRENPEGIAYSYDYALQEVESGVPILPVLGLRGEL